MRTIRFTPKSVPVVFGLVTVAAYGLLLPVTGFYWDDWPFAWIAHFLGPAEFVPAFSGFRPFLGPLFFLTTTLLPADPVVWQTFALLIHLAAGLAMLFALRQVWPAHKQQTLAAALLFLVYPGYSQHWVALTHINQEWISLIAYLVSFGLTARAMRSRHGFLAWTAAAVLLEIVGLLPTEYFVGLEPLRFMLIWVLAVRSTGTGSGRLRTTLRVWWPYVLVWLANALWLLQYYRSGAYVSYELTVATAAPRIGEAVAAFFDALWKAGIYSWFQVLVIAARSLSTPSNLGALALAIGSFCLLTAYLSRLELDGSGFPYGGVGESAQRYGARMGFARSAVVIGITGILLGRLPSFAAGLPLTLQSSFDRFMISMMFGASLLVVGLLELLIESRRTQRIMIAALVALGVGQQFLNANIFRRDWMGQQEIYAQLAWRIPDLAPHTAILTQQMPLDYETDLSMTAAVNWMYAPEYARPTLPYAVLYTEKRIGGAALPELRPDVPIRLPLRTMQFDGNTSDVIVIYVPVNGCLRVFDPHFDDMETYSPIPDAVTAAIPLSRPALIRTEAAPRELPDPPFVDLPTDTWCYIYEKAELARQDSRWEDLVGLRMKASAQNLEPQDAFEWLPFIEAEARLGDLSWARQMSLQVLEQESKIQRGLCVLWKRVGSEATVRGGAFSRDLQKEIGCGE